MASLIEIANQALVRVGDDSILSLIDNTERARAVNASWPFVRQEVLRSHPWNAATIRTKLAALVDAPSWEFTTKYELPADCLILLQVDTTGDWRVEGRELLTDTTGELGIRYIKDETDTGVYDGLLAQTMAIRLAVEIVERVTNSHTKREMLMAEFEDKLAEARSADGHESSPADFEEDDWVTVRL